MSVLQVAQYCELRQALIVANNGASAIHLSTLLSDVTSNPPRGITVAAGGNYQLVWHDVGELVQQQWYCECTPGPVLTWEWISTPQLGDPPYTGDCPPIKVLTAQRGSAGGRRRGGKGIARPAPRAAVSAWLRSIGGVPPCSR